MKTTMNALIVGCFLFFTASTVHAQTVARSYETSSGSHVNVYSDGKVEETWTSDNGDRNTMTRDNGTTTTQVDHQNGTREVNGVQVNDNGGNTTGNQGNGPGETNSGNGDGAGSDDH